MKVEVWFEERASPNIALIKYWGKLQKSLNIPLNGSCSLTLDENQIYSLCAVRLLPKVKSNSKNHSFELVDMNQNVIESTLPKRFDRIVEFFTLEFCKNKKFNDFETKVFQNHFLNFVFEIKAKNSFPTSAGMASSASGTCALILAISRIFNFFDESEQELKNDLKTNIIGWLKENNSESKIQKIIKLNALLRIISGSSSRSLYPGFVLLNGIQNEFFGQKNKELENLNSIDESLPLLPKDNSPFYSSVLKRFSHCYSKNLNSDFFSLSEKDQIEQLSKKCFSLPYFYLLQQSKPEKIKNLENFIENLRIMVVVLKKEKKKISSRGGMIQSSLNSENLVHRVNILPEKNQNMLCYIDDQNYSEFFKAIIRDR